MSCGVPTLSTFLHPENKRYSNDPKSMQMAFRMARIFQCEIARSIFDRVQNWVPKKRLVYYCSLCLEFWPVPTEFQQSREFFCADELQEATLRWVPHGMTGISVIPQKMHYDAALWMRRVQCFAYFYHSPIRITIFLPSHSDKTSIAGEDSK